MIKHTKDILLYKVSKKTGLYSEDEMKEIKDLSETVSKEELINIIYKLSELEGKMKASSQKTIIFETEIIKLCVKMEVPEVKVIREVESRPAQGEKTVTTTASSSASLLSKIEVRTDAKKTEKPTNQESPKIEKAEALAPGEGLSRMAKCCK